MDLNKQYVIIDRIRFPLGIKVVGDHIELQSRYNPAWLKIVKTEFENPKWCGTEKVPRKDVWKVPVSVRNLFRLAFHQGLNPYARYDQALPEWVSPRKLLKNQYSAAAHMFNRRRCILAGEMGTGKTLSFFEVIQKVVTDYKITDTWSNVWYVGPKSGVRSVTREINKWQFPYRIQMFTYQKLVNELKGWSGAKSPMVFIIDEAHCIKNPTSQRTEACKHISLSMLKEHGASSWVLATTGTPAPRNPADWWALCEVTCPGFLAEGHRNKLVDRCALVEQRESVTGGAYPHLVTWFDDESKCLKCGMMSDHRNHQSMVHDPVTQELIPNTVFHQYEKCKNEVSYLFERMKGLVLVQFKKDCLDLPDKTYEIIRCNPSVDAIRAMRSIKATTGRAVTALMRLRELSDGFQYTDIKIGTKVCPVCDGAKQIEQFVADGSCKELMACDCCGGAGEVPEYERSVATAPCPKDDALTELLEEVEEVGRIVIWAGFTGSIDKIVENVRKQGWYVLRWDRQIKVGIPDVPIGPYPTSEILLDAMDASHPRRKELELSYPKVAFVGHPGAGGMGLTLTSAPLAVYYSNPFNADARIQSEDRIHRAGMDTNRACKIVDIFNLPTDELVYNNLRKKRDLQSMTMMELEEFLNGNSSTPNRRE